MSRKLEPPKADADARAAVARQAALHVQRGNLLEAARVYAQSGDWLKAAGLYAHAGYHGKAGEAYERGQDLERAAEAFERHFTSETGAGAASTAANQGRRSALRAGQLYARSNQPEKALGVLVRGRYFEEAARLAYNLGRFGEAADAYMRADQLAKAAGAWDQAGQPVRAALARGELAFREDRLADAAASFAQGGDHGRAAELFESLGLATRAAEAYEAGGAFNEAAEAYLREGLRERAAAAFERAGQLRRAGELFEAVGDVARASALFERVGDALQGARAAQRAGDFKKAIALLQRIEAGEEDYLEASELLAELFLKGGHPQLGIERLQLVLGGEPIAPANVGLHYWLAACREGAGDARGALEIYQRILAVDFEHRDVSERVRRLSTTPAQPGASVEAPSVRQPRTEAAAPAGPAPVPGPSSPGLVPPAPPAGSVQGRFMTREVIGRGPLGTLYRAEDQNDGRAAALRILPASALAPPVLDSLLAHVQPATRLSHPNLVKVLSAQRLDGGACVASELVGGTNLGDFLRSGQRLTLKRCHALGRSLALVLSFVHGKGLVHGSVRPWNVFVVSGIPKLADLGLGPLYRALVAPDAYRAPEDRLDVAGDVFSLGATLYHLLTGRAPARPSPQPAAELAAGVPESFSRLLSRALEPRPEVRFPSCKELVRVLDAMVTIG